MKSRNIVLLIFMIVSLIGTNIFAQDVFSNGINLAGSLVFSNGLITLDNNTQGDSSTRDITPSVGQLYGIDPETGDELTNTNLLTVKPKKLDLETTANRQFVISADQITGDGSVTVDYSGSNVVLGLSETNVQVQGDLVVSSNLEANSITLGGFERSTWPEGDNLGDHTATQNIKLNGHWLSGDGDNEGIYITDAGKIGVGISTPASGFKMELYGPGSGLAIRGVGSSDNKVLIRFNELTTDDKEFEILGMFAGGGEFGNKLKFRSKWTDNIIVMRGDGNVGMGVANPTEKLDVAGAIKASSIKANGSLESGSMNIGGGNTISGDAVGTGAFVQGTNCTVSIGYAHAEGYGTTATGDDFEFHDKGAHAEGYNTTAYGTASHAEGYGTTARAYSIDNAKGAHAEGYQTTAHGAGAHAEGYGTTATSEGDDKGAHSEGYQTSAFGTGAHAEGSGTTVECWFGAGGHAEGYNTTAFGDLGSHAEGWNTTAHGTASHAEGWNTHASGDSHAEGEDTIADGDGAHAEGINTHAEGWGSHAEGGGTHASADRAHAEGSGTHALSFASHAEGYQTTASGDESSHAEGSYTTASGMEGSHAEGINTVSDEWGTHAEGCGTHASGWVSHAEGYESHAEGEYSHAAGFWAHAIHDRTYVWSDGGADAWTPVSSTKSKQYTVHASNGIRLLGGPTEIVPAGDLAMGIYTNHP